jgi:phosphatidylglycerophosphate synthase
VRPSKVGAFASLAYLAAGVIWIAAAHPPGPAAMLAGWFVLVAAAGVFFPGAANQVSLARAYLAAPGLSYASSPDGLGALAVVVAIAGLSDLVDGTIARRFAHPSTLGGGLDPVVDGLFLGAVAAGLVIGGLFPLWLAAVVVARYLLPALVGSALIAMGRRPELRHTLTGQVSTSLITILLGGVALFRGLNQDSSGLLRAAEVVLPVATVATFVHLGWAARRTAGKGGAAVAVPERD